MADVGKFSWWEWLPIWPWRVVATVEAADEVPEKIPRNGVVFVGTRKHPKWLVFDCPCRNRHRIMVSLEVAHSPHWRLTGGKKLTLWPSVDYRTPTLQCHYFIKQGKVIWVHDKERSI